MIVRRRGDFCGTPDLSMPYMNASEFARNGFLAPVPLFTTAQCEFIRRHLQFGNRPEPLGWEKGHFATDRVMYDLAVRPALLTILRQLLGNRIVLWGARSLVRDPSDVHPWHTDIESSAPDGRFVTVWIGIKTRTLQLR